MSTRPADRRQQLEQAPPARPVHALLLSAPMAQALEAAVARLGVHLRCYPALPLVQLRLPDR
jgi:hypothetical protein